MFGRNIVIAVAAVFVGMLYTTVAAAEEAGVQLKEVVVTATKTEKRPQDVTQSVTVITADEIRKSGATTAAEVIRTVAGVTVSEQGPLGATTTVSLRGAASTQVLVLLDGKRLNSAGVGMFDMSELPVPLDAIERIEIVRGPSSALYGADAVGGVVNIITKKPTVPVTTLGGSVGAHRYTSLSLSNAGREDKLYYTLSAGKERSDGYRDNSDTHHVIAGIKLGYDLDANSSIEATSDYSQKEIGVPGSIQSPSPFARQQTRLSISGLQYRERLSKELDFTLKAYQNRERIGYQDPNPFFPINSRHRITTTGEELQANVMMSTWNMLTIGADGRKDQQASDTSGDHSASLSAGYIQDEMNLGDSIILLVGGRNDSHSIYGHKWSPRGSLRYLDADTGTIIRASAGRSFRAPTFDDLYWPFDGFEVGNPNLRPESAEEIEGGIEQQLGKGSMIKGTVFKRRVIDLIAWAPNAGGVVWTPTNINRAEIKGIEAEAKFTLAAPVSLTFNYTHMFPVDLATGDRLFSSTSHIPDMQLGGTLMAALDAKTVLALEGQRTKNYVKPGEEKWDYYTVNGKITETMLAQKDSAVDVFIGMKNMFNRRYETVQGYPMPPQEFYAGITARF